MYFALNMSLVSLAGVGLAFLVSASVSSFAMANILIALPFVFMMVSQSLLVPFHESTIFYLFFNIHVVFPSIAGLWWLSGQPQCYAELALVA